MNDKLQSMLNADTKKSKIKRYCNLIHTPKVKPFLWSKLLSNGRN